MRGRMSKAVYLILGGVFAVAMLSPSRQDAPKPASVAAPVTVPQPVAPMNGGDFTLMRAPDGHFYTDAQVNGTIIRFLVDTGATTVALTKADAAKIGIQFTAADFTETGEGAGGKIALKPVMLDRIIIGTTDAANVEAAIINSPMRTSLLGQSWLRRVGTVEIKGDRMVLR
jgi:aspartyl protease family protein